MDITSNYMIINYLNCLLKAAASLRISSGRQRQAAASFDVSPKYEDVSPSCVYSSETAILEFIYIYDLTNGFTDHNMLIALILK